MATKIVTKNSSTASAVPTASDLVQGELAVNVADKRLFTEDNAGAIVELGTNPYNFTANHNGSAKLTTTSTGIDVTGTLVSDGLTVDGQGKIQGAFALLDLVETDITDKNTRVITSGGQFRVDTVNDALSSSTKRIMVDHATGDISFYEDTGTTPKFFWDASAESLGIGTSSPSKNLHVYNGTTNRPALIESGDADSLIEFKDSSTTNAPAIGATGNNLVVQTGSSATERMRIDASGNLLVGTTDTTPGIGDTNAGISMSATNGIIISRANDAPINISRNSSDGALTYFRKDGAIVGSIGTQGGDLYLGTDDANIKFFNSASIQPVNSVGGVRDNAIDIGSSSARFKDLYLSGEVIAGAGENNNPSITSHVDTDTGLFFGGGNILGFSTGGSERMRIDSSGNLLVGKSAVSFATAGIELKDDNVISITRSAGTALNVNRIGSSAGSTIIMHYNSLDVGSIDVTASATSYTTSSDQRLKENIADADDAGSKIDAIQVRKFDWKVDGSHQDYGMVAQELLEVAPEAVSQGETEDDMMGVDYSKLVPMLIKEIQSLRNRVAQLEE